MTVEATPDSHTHSPPTSAWAEVGSVACSSEDGSGPYDLVCAGAPRGRQTLTVHVENAYGVTTDVHDDGHGPPALSRERSRHPVGQRPVERQGRSRSAAT